MPLLDFWLFIIDFFVVDWYAIVTIFVNSQAHEIFLFSGLCHRARALLSRSLGAIRCRIASLSRPFPTANTMTPERISSPAGSVLSRSIISRFAKLSLRWFIWRDFIYLKYRSFRDDIFQPLYKMAGHLFSLAVGAMHWYAWFQKIPSFSPYRTLYYERRKKQS